jgi:hypothetical protein
LRYFSLHDVAIFFATVVSSVENLDPIHFNNEHGRAYNMSRHIGCYLDAIFFGLNPKLNRINAFQTVQNLLVIEQSLVPLDLGGIANQIVVDIFGGFGHVDLAFVVVPGQEVRKRTAVVQMCMGYYDHCDLFGVDAVEERQTVGVLLVYHQSAVQHYLFRVYGQDQARTAHLAARPQRQD